MTIIERLFRNIFFLIDDVIYNQIPKLYNLLITIAKTSPLSQANIADMASRIYKLLAVFMVFKVTLSLIMYVVNPDDFSDKSKGISKLITNIVISLAVLVLTPFIFSYGYQFQEIILKDNSLAAVVFGSELTKSKDIINDAGEQMAYLSITPFVTPNLTYFNCSSIYSADVNSKADLKYDCFGFNDLQEYIKSEEACTSNSALCSAARDNESNNSKYLTRDDVINYAAGISNNNFNYVFRKNLVTSYYYDTKDFAFDYSFIMSTVVGVMIALFLITSCMDIGLRSIKLAFLQLIAPIPILSYVDPKSGKDGMFKKWYQMALKTYLSLFIKILVIYFAVYIIGNLDRLVNVIDGSYVTNGYVKIFIMIGALMFAKNFTKILESLGVKLDGGFTLNPFKKLENEALGMKKPAALANKVAKGILASPITGIQTLGKKTIGGIDAARNGKGFKQGWNRTHGNLYNKFYKKLDEWAPDSAEARKNERIGREEVRYMNTKWNKGKANADKLWAYVRNKQAAGDTTFDYSSYKSPYEALNGSDIGAYQSVYKNREFIQSRMALDRKDEARKALERVNEATLRGQSLQDALKSQHKFLRANLDEATYNKLFDESGNAKWTNDNLTEFSKLRDDTTKSVAGMEKVHESLRKQYQADAAVEDAIKFVKYNPIDPSEPTKPKAEFPKFEQQSSETQVEAASTEVHEQQPSDSTPDSSENSDSSFRPLYDSIDDDINNALSEFNQYNELGETAEDSARQQELENRLRDLENKKIDDQIRILNAELVQYDGMAMSPEDVERQNEILRQIADLQRRKR